MFGVCYYPEHWSEDLWSKDAQMMRDLGLTYVRIGEFAWSRIEPTRDNFQFDWLDRAINILGDAGLKVVFGTPTATPPKWLIDEHPEILPVDPETGTTRGFGSRRHYDFSSERYFLEAMRITEVLVKRYGNHPAIVGWQTDNEISCHDTTVSISSAALKGFRAWCKDRYGDIDSLNKAWGNVFWSMEYNAFDTIDIPYLAVTETNPAHRLAFLRYSSDKVVAFHDVMVKIIREHAPNSWITHNFIPKEDLYMDAYALGAPIDFASYDNYPLGRTDVAFADASPEIIQKYMRTGHPDLSAFYHDTSRSFSKGDFWVMEQQPGPVNWAANNPRPKPGMVRFWSLEAFAHGAACVSYFRWRQLPYAQEQMHAALLRPDQSKATAWAEIEQVMQEVTELDILSQVKEKSQVAIVTDVQALWVTDIQPQGQAYDFKMLELSYYTALRELGLTVDFVSKDHELDGYKLIVVPCLPIIPHDFIDRCEDSGAEVIFGPRSGSKTPEFSVPLSLAPDGIQDVLPVKVLSVETLRSDIQEPLVWKGNNIAYQSCHWCEDLKVGEGVEVIATYDTSMPAIVKKDQFTYLGTVTDAKFLKDFFRDICVRSGIQAYPDLPEDMRLVTRGNLVFLFNYADKAQQSPNIYGEVILGHKTVAANDVSVWRLSD